jgi:hypothetical protein
MKVLLDENIDIRFKKAFAETEHEVYTINDMGWNGIKNGALLQKLQENDFDALVAVDKNLPYQQNEDKLPVPIFILNVKRNILSNILALVPSLLEIWKLELQNKFYMIPQQSN